MGLLGLSGGCGDGRGAKVSDSGCCFAGLCGVMRYDRLRIALLKMWRGC